MDVAAIGANLFLSDFACGWRVRLQHADVAQHSGATAASVTLAGDGGSGVSLFIIDNGSGFDANKAKASAGLGLLSIEERARTIGASVAIESMLDAGTRLSVQTQIGDQPTQPIP